MMRQVNILWTDDEIDLLKPHILFLESKGYKVITASNGDDALNKVQQHHFDLMFLDENMPGLSGLEVLNRIKSDYPGLPVVMITKSEEEDIMDAAIGSKITDYLIKPVNPNQILLTIKKILDNKRLITQETTSAYQSQFAEIGHLINQAGSMADWKNIYKKLVYWELELETSRVPALDDVLKMQKSEASAGFSKYISSNYSAWFTDNVNEKPLFSPSLLKEKVFPYLERGEKVVLILIDNMRLDQWQMISPEFTDHFQIVDNDLYCSILPTTTQYARNSMFAGLMPLDIKNLYPEYWLDDEEEGNKNNYEQDLLKNHLQRTGKSFKLYYEKIFTQRTGKKVIENLPGILQNDLIVIVYNFVDMLSHARTELNMIKELANDEAAYRSLTLSWFQHSNLPEFIQQLAEKKVTLVVTTDHGSIQVNNPQRIIGDKKTSTNLRYKHGKNLNFKDKSIYAIHKPEKVHLPVSYLSSTYAFATNDHFLVYPNNYNYYANHYKNTFQHGGISMEEMLIPVAVLAPK